jgi:hypothetical protein
VFEKPVLIFEQIKTAGQLYELKHGGPNKLIHAMQRFSDAADPTLTPGGLEPGGDNGDSCYDRIAGYAFADAATMALEFLECTYNGGPVPPWLDVIENPDPEE